MSAFENTLLLGGSGDVVETYKPNGSLAFQGPRSFNVLRSYTANSRILMPTTSNASLRKLTLSFWMKMDPHSGGYSFSYLWEANATSGGVNPCIMAAGQRSGTTSSTTGLLPHFSPFGGAFFYPNGVGTIDPGSWHHYLIQFDTDNATAVDRVQYYIDGVGGDCIIDLGTLITSTQAPQNADVSLNRPNYRVQFGSNVTSSSQPGGGRICDWTVIDDELLGPDNFGEYRDGIWLPKEFTAFTASTESYRLDPINGGIDAGVETTTGYSPNVLIDQALLGNGTYSLTPEAGANITTEERCWDTTYEGDGAYIDDVAPGAYFEWSNPSSPNIVVGNNDSIKIWLTAQGVPNAATGTDEITITGTNITTQTITGSQLPLEVTVKASNQGTAFTSFRVTNVERRGRGGISGIKIEDVQLINDSESTTGTVSYDIPVIDTVAEAAYTDETNVAATRYFTFPIEHASPGISVANRYIARDSGSAIGMTEYGGVATDGWIDSGKYAVEVHMADDRGDTGDTLWVGIIEDNGNLAFANHPGQTAGTPTNKCYAISNQGTSSNNRSTTSSFANVLAEGERYMLQIDMTAGTMQIFHEGTSQGTITGIDTALVYRIAVWVGNTAADIIEVNVGDGPYISMNPIDNSFLPCFYSRRTPAPSITNPSLHVGSSGWVGNGTSQTVDTSCTADICLMEEVFTDPIEAAADDYWHDTERGATLAAPKDTGAEVTKSNGITAINASSLSIGSDVDYNDNSNLNEFSAVYWECPTTETNTTGTVNAEVSRNNSAGIAVAKWTNTAGNYTIGHGLGAAPGLIFFRDLASGGKWTMGCTQYGWGNVRDVSGTTADATNGVFQSTAPTSTVISFDGNNALMGTNMIAYIFAEVEGFSQFGVIDDSSQRAECTASAAYYASTNMTRFTPKVVICDAVSEGMQITSTIRPSNSLASGPPFTYPKNTFLNANNSADDVARRGPIITANGIVFGETTVTATTGCQAADDLAYFAFAGNVDINRLGIIYGVDGLVDQTSYTPLVT